MIVTFSAPSTGGIATVLPGETLPGNDGRHEVIGYICDQDGERNARDEVRRVCCQRRREDDDAPTRLLTTEEERPFVRLCKRARPRRRCDKGQAREAYPGEVHIFE